MFSPTRYFVISGVRWRAVRPLCDGQWQSIPFNDVLNNRKKQWRPQSHLRWPPNYDSYCGWIPTRICFCSLIMMGGKKHKAKLLYLPWTCDNGHCLAATSTTDLDRTAHRAQMRVWINAGDHTDRNDTCRKIIFESCGFWSLNFEEQFTGINCPNYL